MNMPELPLNAKAFRGFDLTQSNIACQHFKINGFIFDWEISADGFNGKPGCLNWRSDFVEGGTRINMLRYESHLMYIKNIKCLFKQWQCGKCRRCFNKVYILDTHVKTYNGDEIKHVWAGGVFEPKKYIKQSLADFGFNVSNHDF